MSCSDPWAKVEPIIMGMRRELDWPDAFDYFERLGRDYLKWWEGKRKRVKPLPPITESPGAPKALTVARTRPPAPVRPPAPPRPTSGAMAARPVAAVRPAPTPVAAVAAKPTLRVLAKPSLKLGKAIKVVKKSKSKPKPKAKGKRR